METNNGTKTSKKMHRFWHVAVEMFFIVFLFYSNLLMGEFTRSGMGQVRGFWWAFGNIFTGHNFLIAIVAALVGYVVFEFLRRKY